MCGTIPWHVVVLVDDDVLHGGRDLHCSVPIILQEILALLGYVRPFPLEQVHHCLSVGQCLCFIAPEWIHYSDL